jgi:3',5'-cyclic AMP phosphodiesterase CpdA
MTSPDALVIAGDITENGLDAEYGLVYDDLSICNNINNYMIATGNHDIRLRSYEKTTQRFTQLYNEFTGSSITSLNYSVVINGYYFIVLASDENSFEKAVISDEQLLWLDETLAEGTNSGLLHLSYVISP